MGDLGGGGFSDHDFFPRRLLRPIIGVAWKAALEANNILKIK
jgi:hypothetical protein